MNSLQKTLLKNEIKIQLSKAKITHTDLKQVKKDERYDFIEAKLLEINDASLRWALQKQIISEDLLTTDKFFTENTKLSELITNVIVNGGLATAGAFSSLATFGATLTTSTTGGFLGFFGTTTLVTTSTTIMATAVPIVATGALMFGVKKYKENQKIKKLIKHFELEKERILNFYVAKINSLKILER